MRVVNGRDVNLLCIDITAGLNLPSFLATCEDVRWSYELAEESNR
jgi:hypothetical protein